MTNDNPMNDTSSTPNIVFFGTPDIAVAALEELAGHGISPVAIVTAPDRPRGRGMRETPPPAKIWAEEHSIPVLQPETLDEDFCETFRALSPDLSIVVAYGKILPKELLAIPPHGFLNVHPSLLPAYRGAAPIESALLAGEEKTGVTIIKMDEEMDHGPILAQRAIYIADETISQLRDMFGQMGIDLIVEILPDWLSGKLQPIPQNHDEATFTRKIVKADGEIDLNGDPQENLRKVRALGENPGTFCFVEKNNKKIRVAIKGAREEDGQFIITRAAPEGKKEMNESEFQNWLESDTK